VINEDLQKAVQAALEQHISASTPEGMKLPYPMHWVLAFSVADGMDSHVIHLRLACPMNQPSYVTGGLLVEAADILDRMTQYE